MSARAASRSPLALLMGVPASSARTAEALTRRWRARSTARVFPRNAGSKARMKALPWRRIVGSSDNLRASSPTKPVPLARLNEVRADAREASRRPPASDACLRRRSELHVQLAMLEHGARTEREPHAVRVGADARPLRRGDLRELPHPHTQDRTLPSRLPGASPHWLVSDEVEQKGGGGVQSAPQQGTTQKKLEPHVVLPQGTGGGKVPHARSCNASATTATKRMMARAVGAMAMTEHATDSASASRKEGLTAETGTALTESSVGTRVVPGEGTQGHRSWGPRR